MTSNLTAQNTKLVTVTDIMLDDPQYRLLEGDEREDAIKALPAWLQARHTQQAIFLGPWPYECKSKDKCPNARVYHSGLGTWWHEVQA